MSEDKALHARVVAGPVRGSQIRVWLDDTGAVVKSERVGERVVWCGRCGESLWDLTPDRAQREAFRAHEALMRYGKHDEDCPALGDGDCDCGLDAACYSPFVPESGEA